MVSENGERADLGMCGRPAGPAGRPAGREVSYSQTVSELPFEACWHRLDRANVHRQSLVEIWNGFIADHPYDFSLDHQGGGVFILRLWQERPFPSEFAVITGEWLYSLRCTLDYIMWATAVYVNGSIPPPGESTLQYPIYENEGAWDKNLHRLKPLSSHHCEMLRKMQPFNSNPDANYLGCINRLARIDRHRRLTIATSYAAEIAPVIGVPHGCATTLQWGTRVVDGDKADVARIVVTPWQDDFEVQANPRIGIDPEIAEWATSPFWSRIRFTERLTMMQAFVGAEIAVYEYDCIGSSRKASLLTDTYRAECDARRVIKPIVRERTAPPGWGPPIPGKPSTREALRGEGFPSGPAAPHQ